MSFLSGTAEIPSRLRFNIPIIWILAIAAAAAACIPLIYLIVRAAQADADAWADIVSNETLRLLLNTAVLAVSVTATSAALALPMAYLTERTDLPFARWWRSITIMPLAVPSYVGAFAFIVALGPHGSLQELLAPLGVEHIPSLYGFVGSWLVLTLFTYPYLLLVIRAGLRNLDPAIEEAARSLGQSAWGAFWRVTVPQLRVPLAAGGLLVALYVISDFGAVSMMRFDTFTRAIYVRFGSTFDRSTLAVLSIVLVGLIAVVLAVDWSQRRNARYHRLGSGAARTPRLIQLRRLRWPAVFGSVRDLCAVALLVPVAVLFHWLANGIEQGETFPGLWTAALNSMEASALAGACRRRSSTAGRDCRGPPTRLPFSDHRPRCIRRVRPAGNRGRLRVDLLLVASDSRSVPNTRDPCLRLRRALLASSHFRTTLLPGSGSAGIGRGVALAQPKLLANLLRRYASPNRARRAGRVRIGLPHDHERTTRHIAAFADRLRDLGHRPLGTTCRRVLRPGGG